MYQLTCDCVEKLQLIVNSFQSKRGEATVWFFWANISKMLILKKHDSFVYLCGPQRGRFLQSQFERSFRGSGHFHNFGSNTTFYVLFKRYPHFHVSSSLFFSPEQTHIPVDPVLAEPSMDEGAPSSPGASLFCLTFLNYCASERDWIKCDRKWNLCAPECWMMYIFGEGNIHLGSSQSDPGVQI